jgi:cell division protein FtsN
MNKSNDRSHPMRSRLLVSVSAAALIAGAGLVHAQDKGPAAAPQTTSPAQQSTTPSQPGGSGAPGGQMQQRQETPPARAQQDMDRGDQKQQRAQEQREQRQDRAQDKSSPKADRNATDTKSDRKGDATTGQGAAGSGSASLTSEQRSKISTNIRQTNVKRETNVNFNISVGTTVPRTVTLHALPPTVVEVYPQWRGYRFVLVEDEIIIIEPGSYRIVAVIDA